MPPKRVPLKGEPDFTNISDAKLKEMVDTVQSLIFSYQSFDRGIVNVLQTVWKQLSDEKVERLCESAKQEIDRQEQEESTPAVTHRVKTIKLAKPKKSLK